MRTLLFACCGFLLAGCGGSGGGGTTPPPTLTGEWSGPWTGGTFPPPGNSGTVNITIEPDGDITGSVFNAGYNETGIVSGKAEPSGKVHFTIDYASHDCDVNGTPSVGPDSMTGMLILDTEEYNSDPKSRTIHVYSMFLNLDRQ